MSGAEAIVVLGVISSIISIVDGIKQIYDAATNAQGLPEAFRDVAGRLTVVRSILSSAKQHIDNGDIDEESCRGVQRIVEACEKKAKKLDELFHSIIPTNGASDLKRYYKVVKAYRKGNEVENLMKGLLEDVQLLACEHGMKTATKAQQEQIIQAIRGVSAIRLDQPESLPTPSSTIPFRRDPDFIVRQTLLDQLHEKCATPAARTAIVGLGGVGKSQLAIEYSYQVRCQSPETWVFWVHASNAARFEQSCRDIADHIRIPGREDSKADIFKLIHDWLRDESNGKWLLILDNADDFRWLFETQTASGAVPASESHDRSSTPLWEHLPQSQHGSVLVTTRSRSVALKLVEERDIIAVEPMDEVHAVALFEKKLLIESSHEDSVELVAALEFMPLAVVQAAAYINQRAPRCSVREYIEKFQKTDRSKTSLLTYEAGHLRRDRDAKNSIIITWQISFDHIRQERPSAVDLLSLMSFFDRQGIPEGLLRNKYKVRNKHSECGNPVGVNDWRDEEDSGSESSAIDDFEDDLLVLRNYSFISANIDKTSFGMHRLVQLATWKWLEAHSQLEKWKQLYINSLCVEFPNGQYENWTECGILFPHVQLALTQEPEGDDSLRKWALLLFNAAEYACQRGSLYDAEKLSIKSMEVRKRVLGPEDPDTLACVDSLALIYHGQGRFNEAEELGIQVLQTRKRVLGPEHPDTLASINTLVLIYWKLGRWKEAEELGVQAVEIQKRVLGQDHPDTLISMNNLALTYQEHGRWKEAEELVIQGIEISKKVFGEEHPQMLTWMNNLAWMYQGQGKWKEAEELDIEVIKKRKKVIGQEHPSTLTTMSNLALIFIYQERWEEAEELVVQVMEIRKRVLGPEHPDTLLSMNDLVLIYHGQGRFNEAEELGAQVVVTKKRVLGPEHPETLTSMSNLALTYSDQARWKEAEELAVQVMEARKRVPGPEHPDTLTGMGILEFTYQNQGRLKEAEELGMQVLEARKRVLGPENPDTILSMNNLAWTWKGQKRDEEALDLMSSCLELSTRKLGANHPSSITRAQTYNKWKSESHSMNG